jgi:hypothetical protein
MRAGSRGSWRIVLAVITLGAAVGLLAGCGGGGGSKPLSKADYNKQMTAIGKTLSDAITELGTVTTAAAAATELAKVQVDLRSAVKQVGTMTPPANVKAQTQQLAAAVSEFASELGPVIAKLKAGNLQALSSVTSLKGLKDIQTAAAAITKAGYTISS